MDISLLQGVFEYVIRTQWPARYCDLATLDTQLATQGSARALVTAWSKWPSITPCSGKISTSPAFSVIPSRNLTMFLSTTYTSHEKKFMGILNVYGCVGGKCVLQTVIVSGKCSGEKWINTHAIAHLMPSLSISISSMGYDRILRNWFSNLFWWWA